MKVTVQSFLVTFLSFLFVSLSGLAMARQWEFGYMDDNLVARVVVSPNPRFINFILGCRPDNDLVVFVRASEHAGKELIGHHLELSDQGWKFETLMSDHKNSNGVFISVRLNGAAKQELLRGLSGRRSVMVRIDYASSLDNAVRGMVNRFEFRLPLEGSFYAINQLASHCR